MGEDRAERAGLSTRLGARRALPLLAGLGVLLTAVRGSRTLATQVTAKAITITIKPEPYSRYRVQFIGRNGDVLSEAISNPAVYEFTGNELYVRARILESNGRVAWMQPVWRGR